MGKVTPTVFSRVAPISRAHRTHEHSLALPPHISLSLRSSSSTRSQPARARLGVRVGRAAARAGSLRQAGRGAPWACCGCGSGWTWAGSRRPRSWHAWRRSTAAISTRSTTFMHGANGDHANPASNRRPKRGLLPPWRPPWLQRQPLHGKFGCNRRNGRPLEGSKWRQNGALVVLLRPPVACSM